MRAPCRTQRRLCHRRCDEHHPNLPHPEGPGAVARGPRVGANAEGLPRAQKIDIAAVKLTGAQSPRYPLIASAVRIAPKSAAMPRDAIRKLQENFSSRC